MSTITVSWSDDAMKAFCCVTGTKDKSYPSIDDVLAVLSQNKITTGIDTDAIEDIVRQRRHNSPVTVAQGIRPVKGTDGSLVMLLERREQGKPRERKNGSVDHRERGLITNIRKGTPLLRRIPPTEGRPGATVFGESIPPPPLNTVAIPKGNGLAVSPTDPDLIIAEYDGALCPGNDGSLDIRTDTVITHDIDYSTGNVTFAGDLIIKGIVKSGFSVTVDGSLTLYGAVERSVVVCGNDLMISGGANGSHDNTDARLDCRGNIFLRHCEYFSVASRGCFRVMETIFHCAVKAGGPVTARDIVGGSVASDESIEAERIGNESGTQTLVSVGGIAALSRRRAETHHLLAAKCAARDDAKKALFSLVRNGMNCSGILEEIHTRLDKSRDTILHLREACESIGKILNELNEKIENSPQPFIKAACIFPGVVVTLGHSRMECSRKIQSPVLTLNHDEIVLHTP